jgi:5-formyltetrahydrofolate cyclo-ligase
VPETQRPHPGPSPARVAKTALRDQLTTARKRRGLAEVAETGRLLRDHLLALPEVRRAATVASYVSVGSEPGTGLLLEALHAAGKRVIVPVVLPDLDLDWAVHPGSEAGLATRRGLLEPEGPRLGVDAIATADVVLVPGLAVDTAGYRMGKGGGCYDRALARVPVGTPTIVLLYDDEVGLDVPVEPHDRPVLAAASGRGITPLSRGRGPAGA